MRSEEVKQSHKAGELLAWINKRNEMKKSITGMLLLLVLTGAAQAQLRKCTGPDGRVTYSDVRCSTGAAESNVRANANTLDNSGARRQARQEERQRDQEPSQPAPSGATASTSCPSEQEIRNLETSANSITYNDKKKERDFLQTEIRRARACAKEGGNYTKDDWARIKEGQDSQGNITAKSRQTGRDLADGVHSSASSDREQERMRTDKLIEAERESRERARSAQAQITSCDKAGCWDTNGARYNRAAGGNFVRSDGEFCRRVGPALQCN